MNSSSPVVFSKGLYSQQVDLATKVSSSKSSDKKLDFSTANRFLAYAKFSASLNQEGIKLDPKNLHMDHCDQAASEVKGEIKATAEGKKKKIKSKRIFGQHKSKRNSKRIARSSSTLTIDEVLFPPVADDFDQNNFSRTLQDYVTYFHYDADGNEIGRTYEQITDKKTASISYFDYQKEGEEDNRYYETACCDNGFKTNCLSFLPSRKLEKQNPRNLHHFSLQDFQRLLNKCPADKTARMSLRKRLVHSLGRFQQLLSSSSGYRFIKYAAVPQLQKDTVFVPKVSTELLKNHGDPQMWMDVQNVYITEKTNKNIGTSLKCFRAKSEHKFHDGRISEEFNLPVVSKSDSKIFPCQLLCNTPQSLKSGEMGLRFDNQRNSDYCKVLSSSKPKFIVTLRMQLSQQPDELLCHIKTELLACAIKEYFHPYQNVEVLWLHNLLASIEELIDIGCRPLAHLHKTLLPFSRYLATLCLSPDAATMMRHKDLCFLDTVTKVIEIKSNELLILKY